MKNVAGRDTVLLDEELLRREADNRAYMLRLTRENLMRNYLLEAGLWGNASLDPHMHGGWESPTCALRGHFTGHYLSASAMIYQATGNMEIKGRADAMVDDLARCQAEHGDGWAGSIPEKYLDWIARGKPVWAPHYTVHKTLMGLVDMARLAGNQQALAEPLGNKLRRVAPRNDIDKIGFALFAGTGEIAVYGQCDRANRYVLRGIAQFGITSQSSH